MFTDEADKSFANFEQGKLAGRNLKIDHDNMSRDAQDAFDFSGAFIPAKTEIVKEPLKTSIITRPEFYSFDETADYGYDTPILDTTAQNIDIAEQNTNSAPQISEQTAPASRPESITRKLHPALRIYRDQVESFLTKHRDKPPTFPGATQLNLDPLHYAQLFDNETYFTDQEDYLIAVNNFGQQLTTYLELPEIDRTPDQLPKSMPMLADAPAPDTQSNNTANQTAATANASSNDFDISSLPVEQHTNEPIDEQADESDQNTRPNVPADTLVSDVQDEVSLPVDEAVDEVLNQAEEVDQAVEDTLNALSPELEAEIERNSQEHRSTLNHDLLVLVDSTGREIVRIPRANLPIHIRAAIRILNERNTFKKENPNELAQLVKIAFTKKVALSTQKLQWQRAEIAFEHFTQHYIEAGDHKKPVKDVALELENLQGRFNKDYKNSDELHGMKPIDIIDEDRIPAYIALEQDSTDHVIPHDTHH